MKDRLLTIVGGLLALAVVVVLLAPPQRDESPDLSRPLSSDRGAQGLQGLKRWLDEGGVGTYVLKRRYTVLAGGITVAPHGNLIIVSLPQYRFARQDERDALRDWLARGNNALVLVAVGDLPQWSMESYDSTDREFLKSHEFLQTLGFELSMATEEFEQAREKPTDESPADGHSKGTADARAALGGIADGISGTPISLEPRFEHPLTSGVSRVAARSVRMLDKDWRLVGAGGDRAVLALLGEADHGAAFWEARVGSGRVWLSRYADLFGNVSLGEADNARLMENLLAASLGAHGKVIFDDMHQGATDLYDPKAFFSDPRFLFSMTFLAGFWLLYLVGSSRRLAPPRETPTRYYAADLARAMAGLIVRRVNMVEVERQLFAHFFNDIRARYGLPTNSQPVWKLLSGMSRVAGDDLAGLQRHYELSTRAGQADLIALTRLMRRTRESLL
jgi:hypothetical protein